MKIQRIFAKDMRQAIRQVRDEHGPDAVILSSRAVEGGVEVISAIDFDQRAMEASVPRAEPPRRQSTPAAAPMPARRNAADEPAFGALLREVEQGAPVAAARRAGGGIDVRVDDALDDDLEQALGSAMAFADSAPQAGHTETRRAPKRAATTVKDSGRPTRAKSPVNVEWTQEPALVEMRAELKTLRSLFENQLSLLDWQQSEKRHPVRTHVLRRLMELGFGPDLCRKAADRVAENVTPDIAFRQALAIITRHTPVARDDLIDTGGVVAVVGPTGVGKTTTVAKLAARFALRHGRQHVALVSTDNFRIGAQDQLRNFARILGVPVHAADDGEELKRVLDDLSDRRLVLVDTAGMSRRDLRIADQFKALQTSHHKLRSYLVMSAGTQLASLDQTARTYKRMGLAGCIITKVDEAAALGPALTVMLRHRLAAAYLGVGQRVPEDLQPARSDRLVQQAVDIVRDTDVEVEDEHMAMVFGGGH
ncbi:flagellar biosynthesis protein FlhF [Natronocella acetinitrilica]|uniref:Flagellar biosynthesis protein FlhF n=1 Tax=Natronocella acetinitrilica TaxID=414046 RepID=A0AAE3KCB2_9GAMM|nr:flagellar biosynthesis protein FlhF [Natronocella acetinitrilica]MCP1675589.1 flagellar biosynthesis protein FlhF [Natronocella acetinitrilica]